MRESAARGIVKFKPEDWEDSMWSGATFNDDNIVVVGATTPITFAFEISSINHNSLAGLPVIIDNAVVASYNNTSPISFSNHETIVSLGGTVGPEGN